MRRRASGMTASPAGSHLLPDRLSHPHPAQREKAAQASISSRAPNATRVASSRLTSNHEHKQPIRASIRVMARAVLLQPTHHYVMSSRRASAMAVIYKSGKARSLACRLRSACR